MRSAGLKVDGAGVDLNGLRVSVCPWRDGPASHEAMQAFLRRETAVAPSAWLWVHHAPPVGVGESWTGRQHAGDSFLVNIIREPGPSCFPGTSITRRSAAAGRGPRASAGPGPSIPASNWACRRPSLNLIWSARPSAGSHRPAKRRFLWKQQLGRPCGLWQCPVTSGARAAGPDAHGRGPRFGRSPSPGAPRLNRPVATRLRRGDVKTILS